MKKILIIIPVLFCMLAAIADTTVVIDIDKVITNSDSYKAFKSSWDKDNAKYQKELEYYESKMIDLDKRILSEMGSSSDREIERMKKKLSEYETTIQKLVEDRKNKLDAEFSQALYKIRTALLELVSEYASQNGISVVLPKSQVVYNDSTNEVTEQVLTELNKKLRTIS